MIVIVDYGLGNIKSVFAKIKRFNQNTIVADSAATIAKATKIILPGVGSFDEGILNLNKRNMIETLHHCVVEKKVPILGICLGMQLMADFSEEGNCKGLGWIKGKVKKFTFSKNEFAIPQVGWNTAAIQKSKGLFENFDEKPRFYFTHSYYLSCENNLDVAALSTYGNQSFVSAIQSHNICGTQFHPEKSHLYGQSLIKNFLEYI